MLKPRFDFDSVHCALTLVPRALQASLLAALVATMIMMPRPVRAAAYSRSTTGQAVGGPQARDTGATAVVTGTVYDSVANAPLAGADIQLVDLADRARAYTARTDSLGRFRFDSVRPGRYAAGFFHPALDALGIEPLVRATEIHAGSDNTLALVIPGPVTVMRALCPARGPHDSTGAMAGIVRAADSDAPITGAKVVVSWTELVIDSHGVESQQRRYPVETGEYGEYRICGLPGADTILASAESRTQHSGVIEVGIPVSAMVRRDFALGDSSTALPLSPESGASAEVKRKTTVLRGTANLSGIVVGPDGKPMSGARIVVWGTGLEATTHSDGHFNLAGLPAGTFSVEARAIGFDPRRVPVDLSSTRAASVQISFTKRVQQLSRVVIMGKRSSRSNDVEDFLRRSRSGMGHYLLGSDDILKNSYSVTQAMRTMPGVNVVPSGRFGNVVLLRGRCVPAVYIDGMEASDGYESLDDLVSTQQIAGIEVYAGLGEVPLQYRSNGCGVVLVWTKR